MSRHADPIAANRRRSVQLEPREQTTLPRIVLAEGGSPAQGDCYPGPVLVVGRSRDGHYRSAVDPRHLGGVVAPRCEPRQQWRGFASGAWFGSRVEADSVADLVVQQPQGRASFLAMG